jgi:RNA polymerase sigma factor (sigma-70 family)
VELSKRNKLVEENMGLVGQVIKDKVHGIEGIGLFTYDDLFQIGCVGLIGAADAYQPDSRACFSTYAYVSIRNAVFDALEYATLRRNREAVTDPHILPGSEAPDFTDGLAIDLDRILDDLQANVCESTAKGIAAIRLLADGYTHREIGERLGGVSANNVTAWVTRARKYLRAQPEFAALGGYL